MLYAPLKEFSGSLRFQLTLWYTGVVLFMVIVTLVGIREGLRITVLHEVDQFLREDMLEIILTIEQGYPNWDAVHAELERKALGHEERNMFVQIFDADGRVRWATARTPELEVPAGTAAGDKAAISSGSYRLFERRLNHGPIPSLIIRVGSTVELDEADLARLTQIMFMVGAVIMLITPLGGFLLAGRATRPLARIIDTTGRMHPSALDERLPIRGTDDELDRLSKTINGFLDRIAAYVRQNREFTANAAHELRSPLAAIRSSLEVALNSERTTGEYQEILTDVLDQCDDLRLLVNQLLLLAEGDANQLCLIGGPLRLDQVILRSIDMFQGVAETRGIALTAPAVEPIRIQGDENRLRLVVNNLIDNAIKFTPVGGAVQVELKMNDSCNAVLTVRDNGEGIEPKELPRIFERFYQCDKARQREGKRRGTGLGLSICKSVVTAHRGTIAVASTPGKGTLFSVRFPNAELAEPLPVVATMPTT